MTALPRSIRGNGSGIPYLVVGVRVQRAGVDELEWLLEGPPLRLRPQVCQNRLIRPAPVVTGGRLKCERQPACHLAEQAVEIRPAVLVVGVHHPEVRVVACLAEVAEEGMRL